MLHQLHITSRKNCNTPKTHFGFLLLLFCILSHTAYCNADSPGYSSNYKKLLAQYFISLKEDEVANDLSAKAEDLNSIGNIFYTLKNYDKALTYYRLSQQCYQLLKMPDAMYLQYFSISSVFRDINQYDSARVCLSKSIQYFKKPGNSVINLMHAYYYCGELLNSQYALKEAIKYYDSAIVLTKKLNTPELFLACLAGKSKLLQETKDYKKSTEFALEGLSVSQRTRNSSYTMQFEHLLYVNYKNLNKPELAFRNLEAYYILNDSLIASKASKAFSEMTSNYENISHERENEILRQQNRNYGLAQKFYSTALILGLLLISSLLYIARLQRKRIRSKNVFIQQEKEIKSQLITTIHQEKSDKTQLINTHQEQLENVTQEKSQITDELERKNNDLLTATTFMIKTNEKLAEISANFRNIASKLPKSSSLNEEIYQTIESIEKLSTKDTWDNFRSKFVDVHPNFFKNLNDRCPGLTQNEMKLAAMISMNLSSKDIAKITMQQHNSINVARYRLRKKLIMESDEQLIGFLLQL